MYNFENIEQLQAVIASSPFNAFCGITVEEIDKANQRMVLRMPMRPELERIADTGQMHGGPIACLVDTAGCFACIMVLGHTVPTINFRIDYLRPVINTSLRAEARVRKAGRSIAVADVDLFDDAGKLVAIGRGTFSAASG